MQTFVADEAVTFLYSLLLGAALAAFYDIFRAKRIAVKTGAVALFLEDTAFWLVACISIILFCFRFDSGKVRGYVILGAVLGAAMYLSTVSTAVMRLFRNAAEKAHCVFGKISSRFNRKIKKVSASAFSFVKKLKKPLQNRESIVKYTQESGEDNEAHKKRHHS